MRRYLCWLLAVCAPVSLWAQGGDPVPSSGFAELLPGEWEVVVASSWIELPDGRRLDQPTDMPAKMFLEFTADGVYRIVAEGEEPEAGNYRLEEAVLTIFMEDGEERQRIEHLSESRLVISVTDVIPDTNEKICLRMVMQRIK